MIRAIVAQPQGPKRWLQGTGLSDDEPLLIVSRVGMSCSRIAALPNPRIQIEWTSGEWSTDHVRIVNHV